MCCGLPDSTWGWSHTEIHRSPYTHPFPRTPRRQKRDKRRLELEDRYEQLAKQGKLEKALSKKRRRNAAKDHRWLPRSRRMGDGGGGGAEGVGGGGGGGGDDEGRGWM